MYEFDQLEGAVEAPGVVASRRQKRRGGSEDTTVEGNFRFPPPSSQSVWQDEEAPVDTRRGTPAQWLAKRMIQVRCPLFFFFCHLYHYLTVLGGSTEQAIRTRQRVDSGVVAVESRKPTGKTMKRTFVLPTLLEECLSV